MQHTKSPISEQVINLVLDSWDLLVKITKYIFSFLIGGVIGFLGVVVLGKTAFFVGFGFSILLLYIFSLKKRVNDLEERD